MLIELKVLLKVRRAPLRSVCQQRNAGQAMVAVPKMFREINAGCSNRSLGIAPVQKELWSGNQFLLCL